MITPKFSLALVSAAALFASAGLASAQSVTVGNPSFETPVVPASGNRFVLFPGDTAGVSATWEQFGTTFKAVYDTATYGGVLSNAAGSSGANGPQAATLSASSGVGGIFQEVNNNYAGTDPLQSFQAGYTYTLTVGVGRRTASGPPLGAQITLRLFSRPADQGAATILASTPLTVGTTPGLEITTSGVLTDYSVSYTVPNGSASIGKPVGIFFDLTSPTGVNNGDFVLDGVRVTAAIPEPTTVAMLGLGAAGLGGYILRRRRQG